MSRPAHKRDGRALIAADTATGWSVSLSYTATSKIALTATVNQPLDGGSSTLYVEIFDVSAAASTRTNNYVVYCHTGTTCSATTVPKESQGEYVAVVTSAPQTQYASLAKDRILAQSDRVLPPPWQISLSDSLTSRVALTATSNYAADAIGAEVEIFDVTGTSSISYVKFCTTGTTCSGSTTPHEAQSTYVAVVGIASSNTYQAYPAGRALAQSNAITPPAWEIRLDVSGSTLTATSNYEFGSGGYAQIFDLSKPQTSGETYIRNCSTTGTVTCVGTATSPSDMYVADVAGTLSNTFPPPDIFALSNQVGTDGPTGPGETTGGANEAELNDCFECAGDPIDTLTGQFFTEATDLRFSEVGPPLELRRSYSVESAHDDGPFGPGWSSDYGMVVRRDPGGTGTGEVTVEQENGSVVSFLPDGTGGYAAPSRVLAALVLNADGTWTYTRRKRSLYDFDASGTLTDVRDLAGDEVTIHRNGAGWVSSATDAAGRSLTFAYDAAGHVQSVTDSTGRTVQYRYDTAGRLVGVTTPGGASTTYTYDGLNRLTSTTDPTGAVTSQTYDGANRVTAQIDPNGNTTGFAYAASTTTITSPTGTVTTETYAHGELQTETEAVGTPQAATWTYTYDPVTLALMKVVDPLGHTTSATYDADGNRLTATDALGHVTTTTYDALGDPLSVTDATGVTTTNTYDGDGNLLTTSTPIESAGSAVEDFTYDDPVHPNLPTSITDPNGNTTIIQYNENGDPVAQTDAQGNETAATYNDRGQRTSVSTATGHTTNYAYDEAGNIVSITAPSGATQTYEYDGDRRITATTDPEGNTGHNRFDPDGHLVQSTSPSGASTTYAYDADGHRVASTDGNSNTTTYTLDVIGRPTTSTDPLGRTTDYSYNLDGELTSSTAADGRTTTFNYDDAGRRTKATYSDQTSAESWSYDADGRLMGTTDSTGSTAITYDNLGRVTAARNGAGQQVSYGYDAASNLTSLTYPDGGTVQRTYDSANRLTELTDPLGNRIQLRYDADGDLTARTDPGGVTTSTSYDPNGNPTSISTSDTADVLASFTYQHDDDQNVSAEIDQGSAIAASSTAYTYTPDGRLASDSNNDYTYDPAGNITAAPAGVQLSYDAASEAASYSDSTGAAQPLSYDAEGNRLSGTAEPTANYSYDATDALTSVNQATNGDTSYAYDAQGLLATATAGGVTSTFAWGSTSKSSRVPSLLMHGATRYIYDDSGTAVEQIDADNMPTYLHQDQYGSTRLLTSLAGAATGTYSYDAYGNIDRHTGATSELQWNGQYHDAMTHLYYLRARWYDPTTAQFVSVDPAEAVTGTPYVYASGNPINLADPLGLWSWNPLDDVREAAGGIASVAKGTYSWAKSNPGDALGLFLGGVAAVTGVGALAIGATAAGSALGLTSAVAGVGAAAIDGGNCLGKQDAPACVGFALGGLSTVAGGAAAVGASLAAFGLLSEGSLSDALLNYLGAGLGINLGLGGLTVDLVALLRGSEGACS